MRHRAAVAELVDAQASGACVRKDVEVRLLSAASRTVSRPAEAAGREPDELVSEADLWEQPVGPGRQPPGPLAHEPHQDGQQEESNQSRVEQNGDPQNDSHLLRRQGTRERKGG